MADSLSDAECEDVARHVDGCPACQAKLAQLTAASGGKDFQGPERTAAHDDAENAIIGRLKTARPTPDSIATGPADATLKLDKRQPATAASREIEWPAVPGYEILGVLGRGGMAIVFKARQLELQRVVALKMLRDSARAGDRELARFRAEADVIARLQHPNIVQIYDVGEVAGRPYFVLEFVAGGNLAKHLNGTPQSARRAAQFVEVLARAVQAAHANGVIHRDLKPGNILLVAAVPVTADLRARTRRRRLRSPIAC